MSRLVLLNDIRPGIGINWAMAESNVIYVHVIANCTRGNVEPVSFEVVLAMPWY